MFSPAVALRKESVDRNAGQYTRYVRVLVALRKESVDRNMYRMNCHLTDDVALRKESVDRNFKFFQATTLNRYKSLSARRAWIEISYTC